MKCCLSGILILKTTIINIVASKFLRTLLTHVNDLFCISWK